MIKYPKRAKQIIDYIGLEYGNIHPTDIDAVLEFDDLYLFLFEIKLEGTEFNKGQKILLERIVDNWDRNYGNNLEWTKSKRKAYAIYCSHNIENTDKNIILANCIIDDIYGEGNYDDDGRPLIGKTVKDYMEIKAKQHNIHKLLYHIEDNYCPFP